MILSQEKKKLLASVSHVLALGGPGSGKTTIALLKAQKELGASKLLPGQSILFLSFARATVARVIEQISKLRIDDVNGALAVETYHGFAWRILKSHGYLLQPARPIRLLAPPQAAAKLADIPRNERRVELQRLFSQEGLLHFDLFAPLTAELFRRCATLAKVYSNAFPIVILDEFQDTNASEWEIVKQLGKTSQLIALADADQRIYEFRGADPRRLEQFTKEFKPTLCDFSEENHRSNGTDITVFGNELLTGACKGKQYNNVKVVLYPFVRDINDFVFLKFSLLSAIERTKKSTSNWSIAVLVPSRRMMLDASGFLSGGQTIQLKQGKRVMPPIEHDVAIDAEGPTLAAAVIAQLLSLGVAVPNNLPALVANVIEYLRGRRGDDGPTQADKKLAEGLQQFLNSGKTIGSTRGVLVEECRKIGANLQHYSFTGDPEADWTWIRDQLEKCTCPTLRDIADHSRYVRLLHKGAILRARLSDLWRTNGSYSGAVDVVSSALLQEHFLASTRRQLGVYVMTMHKAKGKEFDEVVIFEGRFNGKFIPAQDPKKVADSARLMRMAVTRARTHSTILSPKADTCPLLG
ncbi:MAG: ATP-dependent helicase [Planctomycetes bacterium]|nr:ATP-dependent helicase [Planctomycetota bacterium]